MNRRTWAILLLVVVAGAGVLIGLLSGGRSTAATADEVGESPAAVASALAGAPVVTLYKNPTCACCGEWAEHLEENGFVVETIEGADLTEVKARHGITMDLASCHTAEVDGYVLEGHVPADIVRQLLADRPEIRGLAVPGMPDGVPGMPAAGPNRPLYDILAIAHDGTTKIYATR